MKKWLTVWLFICLAVGVFGKDISDADARIIAVNWINSLANDQYSDDDILAIINNSNNDTTLFYVVTFNPAGWVMVAANDRVEPILGYSLESVFDEREMPIQMSEWFTGIKQEISYSFSEEYTPAANIAKKWQSVTSPENSQPILKSAQVSVAPLLSCTWDQGRYYNEMAPFDATSTAGNNHVWIGCVATAIAQVMKYWEFPSQGSGSYGYNHHDYGWQSANFGQTFYNWGAMPSHLTEENEEVQRISYHAAVGVHMDFDPRGSGAYLEDAQNALINYFKYNSTIFEPSKDEWELGEWMNQLKSELDKGRPLIYSGYNPTGSSGHAWVCDGYTNDYFHFNWGWGGYANGNFLLSALTPGGGNYTYNQAALLGIEPVLTSPIPSPYFEGFESSTTGYLKTYGIANVATEEKHSGNYSLKLSKGGFSSYSKNSASLTFTVPAEGHLSFWVKRVSPDTSIYNHQDAAIMTQYGDTILATIYHGTYNDDDWVNYSVSLDAYVGKFIRVMFTQQNFDVSREQWTYLDDVVITGIGQNLAPFTPSLSSPENAESGVALNPTLKWSGGDPNGDFVNYSIYFGTSDNPPLHSTVNDNKFSPGELPHSSTFYWKVIANDGQLQSEGPVWSFKTRDLPPDMALCGVSHISESSATVCGTVVRDNNSTISERGICYRDSPNASIADDKVTAGEQTSNYSCELKNLLPYYTYYIRAYAVSSEGIAYSNEESFSTLPDLSVIELDSVYNIKRTSALVRGIVARANDSMIVKRGVVWSVNKDFDVAHINEISETGQWVNPDTFQISLKNLPGPGTIYYKVFAQNSVGIAYTSIDSFLTINTAPVIDLDADNSSLAEGSSFKGFVSEQLANGKIADVDPAIFDFDGDTITKIKVVLATPVDDVNEFLLLNSTDSTIKVFGNMTDTLVIEMHTKFANNKWLQLLNSIVLFVNSDHPNSSVSREVVITISDGYNESVPASALLTVVPVNDAPVNKILPVLNGPFEIGSNITITPGQWNDIYDQTACEFDYHYQWQVMIDGQPVDIEFEIDQQFLVTSEYCGDSIRVIETVIDDNCGGQGIVTVSIASNWCLIVKKEQIVTFDQIPEYEYTKLPILLSAEASSGLTVTYTMGNNAVAHVSGDTVYIDGTGRAIIVAVQKGNECYLESAPSYRIISVAHGQQEIIINETGPFTYADLFKINIAKSSVGLPLEIISSNTNVASVSNDTIYFLMPGSTTLSFSQPGNDFVNPAETVQTTIVIEKGEQVISINDQLEHHFNELSFDLGIEVSSGLEPLVELSNPEVLNYVNGLFQINGLGNCDVTIQQPGNDYYNAAEPLTATVQIIKGNQELVINLENEYQYGLDEVSFNLVTNSELSFDLSSTDTSVVKVRQGSMSIVGVGEAKLVIENTGNEHWNPVKYEHSITVNKGDQVLIVPDSIKSKYGEPDFSIPVNLESGLSEWNYLLNNQNVIQESNGLFSIIGIGETVVTLVQAGSQFWNPYEKDVVIVVEKGTQVIETNDLGSYTYGDAPFELSVFSNTQLPISLTSSDTQVASVVGNIVTINNAGVCQIVVEQKGNDFWYDATPLIKELKVKKASQDIYTILKDTLELGQTISYNDFYASSNLVIDEIQTSNQDILEMSNDEMILKGIGSFVLTVFQNGNDNFEEVSKDFSFYVEQSTGLQNFDGTDWIIYPNPATDELNISGAFNNSIVSIRILNVAGQEVMRFDNIEAPQKFDIGALREGVYHVSLQSNGDLKSIKLLVK